MCTRPLLFCVVHLGSTYIYISCCETLRLKEVARTGPCYELGFPSSSVRMLTYALPIQHMQLMYGDVVDNWKPLPPFYMENGANFPTVVSDKARDELVEYAFKCVKALGFIRGKGTEKWEP